jgi:hypothetical protein
MKPPPIDEDLQFIPGKLYKVKAKYCADSPCTLWVSKKVKGHGSDILVYETVKEGEVIMFVDYAESIYANVVAIKLLRGNGLFFAEMGPGLIKELFTGPL